jgi:hypothetical protein
MNVTAQRALSGAYAAIRQKSAHIFKDAQHRTKTAPCCSISLAQGPARFRLQHALTKTAMQKYAKSEIYILKI